MPIHVFGKCYKTPFVHPPPLDKAWSFFWFTWEYIHVQFEFKKKNSNEVLKYHRVKSKRQASCDERIYDLMRNDI